MKTNKGTLKRKQNFKKLVNVVENDKESEHNDSEGEVIYFIVIFIIDSYYYLYSSLYANAIFKSGIYQ
jgi:hypothetical protein